MATTQTTDLELSGPFRPYLMTIPVYERLGASGVYGDRYPIFLWRGRLVDKIREGFEETPDGGFPEHRMTVGRFLGLVEAGVFGEKNQVLLWRGRLVEKMTKGRRHSYTALKLDRSLERLMPEGFHVEIEQPMILGDDSLPEPDLMVIRGTLDEYCDRVPRSAEVALIIEVSDSSVSGDTKEMLLAYASEGIPVYWVANIPKRRIEVYTAPTGPSETPSYREHRDYGLADDVPIILDGREVGRVAVREILR